MSDDDGGSPSLDAVRELERSLAEAAAGRAEAEAELEAAREEATRIHDRARARGEAAAAERSRHALAEADAAAARIRSDAIVRAAALRKALTASLESTIPALERIVLPPEGRQ